MATDKLTEKKTGLVLSGGGAHGAYQAGFLKAMSEYSLVPTAISGASIGTMNGYMAAIGEYEEMCNLWKRMERQSFLTIHSIPSLLFSRSPSLLRDEMQREFIKRYGSAEALKKSSVDFYAAAVGLQSGRVKFFNRDEMRTRKQLEKVILASTAIPGIFPPVKIGKEQYIDGGLLANTPIRPLINLELDRIIVISMEPLQYPKKELKSLKDVSFRSMSIYFRNQARRSLHYWDEISRFKDHVDKQKRSLKRLLKKSGLDDADPGLSEKILSKFSFENREIARLDLPEIIFAAPPKALPFQVFDFDGSRIPRVLNEGYKAGIKLMRELSGEKTSRRKKPAGKTSSGRSSRGRSADNKGKK